MVPAGSQRDRTRLVAARYREGRQLLRDELKLGADFVCATVYYAAEVLGRTFDIVFVSIGAVCWLPDIARWSEVVGSLLRPGGRLYM